MSDELADERRYIPLHERREAPGNAMPVPLLIDGQFARVVAVEPSYLVQLEDGRVTVLSYDEYCAAAERARADRWALETAIAAGRGFVGPVG